MLESVFPVFSRRKRRWLRTHAGLGILNDDGVSVLGQTREPLQADVPFVCKVWCWFVVGFVDPWPRVLGSGPLNLQTKTPPTQPHSIQHCQRRRS